jgi:hypothetical protein
MKKKIFVTMRGLVSTILLLMVFFTAGFAYAVDKKQDTILLTIFLRHDQSKTLSEINEHLDKTGFWKKFPPEGTEVVSWYVMMGIGQVVTLSVPPDKLRAVNLAIEQNAWGAYRSEFYATYDFQPIVQIDHKR